MEDSFEKSVVEMRPKLKSFALSLSGNADRADDLVQETFLRAFANKALFTPDTNLGAWLFTILRNQFHTQHRKRRREVEDVITTNTDTEFTYSAQLTSNPSQLFYLEFKEVRAAVDTLPPEQRQAILLVGANGFSYEEAAKKCNCAVGTIKSRVNRARVKLHELLGTFDLHELNKKSWHESDTPERVALAKPTVKQRRVPIWKEVLSPKAKEHEARVFPGRTLSKEEISALFPAHAAKAKAQTAQETVPEIIVEGVRFIFIKTAILSNGEKRTIYQAA